MAAAPKLTIKNLREHANKEGAAFLTYEAIAFQSDNLVFIAVDWTADHRRSPALGKVEKAFRKRVEPFQAEDLSVSRGVRHRSLLNESVCALTATLKERRSQREQFECDKGGPSRTRRQAEGNRRNNEHITHHLHPQILRGRRLQIGWTAIGAPLMGLMRDTSSPFPR
jgi:hypothetical protein